jgi:sec-independent protein translocase protein TatA
MSSPLGLIVIAIVVLVLFGKGKVSSLMGEVGKGINAFKKGIDEGKADIAAEETTTTTTVVAKDVTPIEQKDQA